VRASRASVAALAAGLALGPLPAAGKGGDAAQGEYLFRAALCAVCHTAEEGEFLAGGRPIPTPFGTFYSTNITPDPEHGIGGWDDEDFLRALREGVSPEGEHYYPAFPYTSYTRLKRADALSIKAYLDTVEPVARANTEHDLAWYVDWRWPLWAWKWLYFEEGELEPDPGRDAQWNRGAYLAEAAGHCAECHTPRGPLGALEEELRYAGAAEGPEGESTPNITPDREHGIGKWTERMLSFYLEIGMTPDGDFAGSLMAEVIDDGTGHLTEDDRRAIAAYILSLPPIARPDDSD
jgi:mono/diheme cytochrome c family protein